MKTWSPRVSTDLNSEPLPWDENLFQKKIQGMKVGWILLDELVFLEGPAYGINLAAPNGDLIYSFIMSKVRFWSLPLDDTRNTSKSDQDEN